MQFDQVSVGKKANVFFDGKCVSHTVTLPNGVRKSVGVVLPSTLRFDLSTKEIAQKLFISPYTVNTHRRNIINKTEKPKISEIIKEIKEYGFL